MLLEWNFQKRSSEMESHSPELNLCQKLVKSVGVIFVYFGANSRKVAGSETLSQIFSKTGVPMFFIFFMWFDDDLKIVDQNGVPMQQHVSFGISKNVKFFFEKLKFFKNLEKWKCHWKALKKLLKTCGNARTQILRITRQNGHCLLKIQTPAKTSQETFQNFPSGYDVIQPVGVTYAKMSKIGGPP